MVIYNIPNKGYQRMRPSERLSPLWRKLLHVWREKLKGSRPGHKTGRQPEDKKPSVKGTPPMETPKVPDLTMIHADLLHY
jgi:hypothetical protein